MALFRPPESGGFFYPGISMNAQLVLDLQNRFHSTNVIMKPNTQSESLIM